MNIIAGRISDAGGDDKLMFFFHWSYSGLLSRQEETAENTYSGI